MLFDRSSWEPFDNSLGTVSSRHMTHWLQGSSLTRQGVCADHPSTGSEPLLPLVGVLFLQKKKKGKEKLRGLVGASKARVACNIGGEQGRRVRKPTVEKECFPMID
jgi:hypothetical protein